MTELEKLTNKSKKDLDVLFQCLTCLKIIINTRDGFKEFLLSQENVNKLILCADVASNAHVKIKTLVFDMLSTIMILKKLEGHKMVMEAISYYKFMKHERNRFGHVVDTLKIQAKLSSKSPLPTGDRLELVVSVLTFCNCLVNTPERLSDRLEVRSDLSRLGYLDLMKDLEKAVHDVKEPPFDLETQVKIFVDTMNVDEAEFSDRFQRKKINFE